MLVVECQIGAKIIRIFSIKLFDVTGSEVELVNEVCRRRA